MLAKLDTFGCPVRAPAPAASFQPFHMLGSRRGQIWRYAPEYRIRRPRHFHNEPELNLIVSGHGRFGTGNVVVDVAAGDLVYWPPACDHELLQESGDFDLFVVGATPELSSRVLGDGRGIFQGPIRLPLSAPAFEQLLPLCRVTHGDLETVVAERYVGDLWCAAYDAREALVQKSSLGHRAHASLLLHPDLSREEHARLLCAHPSEVSRYFHKAMGMTLTAYRTRLRLLRFIGITDGGMTTLIHAALQAGFGSYSQCHRVFVRELGCNPRQFFKGDLRAQMRDARAPLYPESTLAHGIPTPGDSATGALSTGALHAQLSSAS